MQTQTMIDLVTTLAQAKSRQDVPAALKTLHPDMVLECPAFGTRYQGLQENQTALERFFASFPDYQVELQGHATGNDTLVSWGVVRMTLTGQAFGVAGNGLRCELPAYIRFDFADGLIASESFFFDLSTLCSQSGVSTDAVRSRLWPALHAGQAARR